MVYPYYVIFDNITENFCPKWVVIIMRSCQTPRENTLLNYVTLARASADDEYVLMQYDAGSFTLDCMEQN